MNPHSHSTGGNNSHAALHHHQARSRIDMEKEHQGPLSLSQQINAASRDGHGEVNRLIMSRLALGLQDHRLYREGILSFALVYKTFEEEWSSLMSSNSSNIDPRIKNALQNLYSTPLLRTPQVMKDLHYYFGSTPFSTEDHTTLHRKAYVAHIRQVVAEKPHVLIAYAYNYYMALFAGGKILKYQISKAKEFFPEQYGMTEDERVAAGTNLFSFEVEQGKEEALKLSFKGALADLERTLTVEERNDIAEESKAIFSHNILLIKELDQICAYLVATSSTAQTEMMSSMGDRYKFFAFFVCLIFFLIGRHMLSY